MYYSTVPVLSVPMPGPSCYSILSGARSFGLRYLFSNVPKILKPFFYQLQIFKFIGSHVLLLLVIFVKFASVQGSVLGLHSGL